MIKTDLTTKKPNILIMHRKPYSGGAEKVAYKLANALADSCNVTLTYNVSGEEQYPLDPRCELIYVPRGNAKKWNVIGKSIRLAQVVRTYRALKKERNIDVSLSLLAYPNMCNVLSACGERVICSERTNPKKDNPQYYLLTKYAYKKADHVIFQSETVRQLFSKRVQEKSSIIMNPVSVPCYAAETRTHRIVTMGRLVPQKNHELLIRSFAAFSERFPEYSLSIYGDGKLKGKLQKLIDQLGLNEKVTLYGNTLDVHEKIRNAEMFVLSSNFEGLSNALLECMMMGIACISTKCEGSTDVIRDGKNGLLVDIGDQNGLTEAMCVLAENPELRIQMEQTAKADAKSFHTDVVIEQWKKVLFEEEPYKE